MKFAGHNGSMQVSTSSRAGFKQFDLFYQNGSGILRQPRASGDRVKAWNLLYIVRVINHYYRKYTLKHSLHYWDLFI